MTQNYRCIRSVSDRDALQCNLDSVVAWSEASGLSFNITKCAVLHFCRRNPGYAYQISEEVLSTTSCVRNLGVLMDPLLKHSAQSNHVTKRVKHKFFSPIWTPHLSTVLLALQMAQTTLLNSPVGLKNTPPRPAPALTSQDDPISTRHRITNLTSSTTFLKTN